MGIWNRKCAVEGCNDKDSPRHRFPMPNKHLETFKKWLEATGNTSITGLNPNLIYRSYRICDRHFTPEAKGANKYLKENAVPTLFCSVPKNKDLENEETSQVAIYHASDHTYSLNPLVCDNPSTSALYDHSYASSSMSTDEPSTSGTLPSEPTDLDRHNVDVDTDINMPSTSKNTAESYSCTNLEAETPKTSKRKKKYSFNILRESGVRKISELSPRAKFMYKKANLLNRSFQTYKKRMVVYKKKHELTEEEQLDIITADLDKHVGNFIKSQIRASKAKSPKGQRYNLDDKVLGLILQKQSGKSYKLFSKLFATPTRKTLMELLNRIPIEAGYNETIFNNLKLRDRVCVLMYDEMALEAHLDINKKHKEFDGFEDHGDKRTTKFGDHAQVFIIKGITKRWKQPVAYTFSEGSTSSVD